MAEYIPKLGEAPTEKDERDAIHIAVVPVEAAMDFHGATHCAIAKVGGKLMAAPSILRSETTVGVVDPFLKLSPKRGKKFWLLLYPGTAIGLRHVYRHPALDPTGDPSEPGQKEKQ